MSLALAVPASGVSAIETWKTWLTHRASVMPAAAAARSRKPASVTGVDRQRPAGRQPAAGAAGVVRCRCGELLSQPAAPPCGGFHPGAGKESTQAPAAGSPELRW